MANATPREHDMTNPSETGYATLIIPVYNQPRHTTECLAALAEHTAGEIEILIVDNGSSEETRLVFDEAQNGHARFHVLRNETNLGFTLAANQGLRAAREEYLVLLNNDVVVTAGWLEGLIHMAESDESIGIVGPNIVNANTWRLQGIGGLQSIKQGARALRADAPGLNTIGGSQFHGTSQPVR